MCGDVPVVRCASRGDSDRFRADCSGPLGRRRSRGEPASPGNRFIETGTEGVVAEEDRRRVRSSRRARYAMVIRRPMTMTSGLGQSATVREGWS